MSLGDDRRIYIFNTKGTVNNVSDGIKEFLEYVENGSVTNEFLRRLDLEVRRVRQNKEWRLEYMKTWIREMELKEEGRSAGIIEGRNAGIIEGRNAGRNDEWLRIVSEKKKKGKTLEEIAEILELEPDDIREMYDNIVAEDSSYN